jgi:ABC-type transport system substrate-binding protein
MRRLAPFADTDRRGRGDVCCLGTDRRRTKNGGIFRFGTTAASVQIDPQLGYVTTAWWLEYATALKLVNWPDRPGLADTRLVLEAASGLAVSNRGKTYTFVIRKSLRFSDGSPVMARSFA